MPVRSENAIQISGTRTPSRSRQTICTRELPGGEGSRDCSGFGPAGHPLASSERAPAAWRLRTGRAGRVRRRGRGAARDEREREDGGGDEPAVHAREPAEVGHEERGPPEDEREQRVHEAEAGEPRRCERERSDEDREETGERGRVLGVRKGEGGDEQPGGGGHVPGDEAHPLLLRGRGTRTGGRDGSTLCGLRRTTTIPRPRGSAIARKCQRGAAWPGARRRSGNRS